MKIEPYHLCVCPEYTQWDEDTQACIEEEVCNYLEYWNKNEAKCMPKLPCTPSDEYFDEYY